MCIRRQPSASRISLPRRYDSPKGFEATITGAVGATGACERSLSLIHISEPTRRTPLYSSAASDVYKETAFGESYLLAEKIRLAEGLRGYDNGSGGGNGRLRAQPVSYTHLRAHETDSSLFVGSVRCV